MKNKILRLVFSIVLLVSAIICNNIISDNYNNLVSFILYLISYLIIGYDIIFGAIKNIVKLELLDEKFLMFIATIGAFIIKENSEAVFVMIFYQFGEMFQEIAVEKSRKSISNLLDLKPDVAHVIRDNQIIKVNPEELKIGELIRILPGEKVPVDGVIISGTTTIDASKLTGESLPKAYFVDDNILSGTINISSEIIVKVEKEFSESTSSKILDLVENASAKKARTENFITKFAHIYTPIVVILGILLAFIPPLILGFEKYFYSYLYQALSFLVISCPCALVISIPLGFFSGIGLFAKNNILVKGSNYIEALANVKHIVFDKTGTITKGNFKVTEVLPNKVSKEELLIIAKSLESKTNHPIGKALNEFASYNIEDVKNFNEIIGYGLKGEINSKTYLIGNENLMINNGVNYLKNNSVGTVLYLAECDIETKFLGSIVISDEIKDDAFATIANLRKMDLNSITLLTGDNDFVAKNVCQKLNIDNYFSKLLPIDKVEKINEIKQKTNNKEKIAFVGDGINDAPVLALSDVGISMGNIGSDAAIEASDVVLMKDEISKIPLALKLSKIVLRVVKQNIVFTLSVKIIIMILATFNISNMALAIFADVGVAFIAIINSLRLLSVKIK